MQKHASGVDVYLQSQRLANEIRSDSCHVFGNLRPLLVNVCMPYAVTKIAKQMEFAQSCNCTLFESFKEDLVELQKVEHKKLSHYSLVEVSTELQATNEATTFLPLPGGKSSLEYLVDDYVDANCVNSSDLEKVILHHTLEHARIVGVQYKLSAEAVDLHLVVLYNNGGYFCSCGLPARTGLICRHFFACFLF